MGIVLLSTSESVEVVDDADRFLFVAPLEECKSRGLLHRTVCVFLRNSLGQILLQQRSISDDWLPGKWTVSCSGHVRAGEIPADAADRELREELGMNKRQKFVFKEFLPPITWSNKTEFEVAYAFECVSDAKISINRTEVQQVKFVLPDEINAIAKNNPDDFTPDAIILLQRYLHRGQK